MHGLQRYALKRKVAGGVSGNFRGVCPILNRASGIWDTVCGVLKQYSLRVYVCAFLCPNMSFDARKTTVFRVFLIDMA